LIGPFTDHEGAPLLSRFRIFVLFATLAAVAAVFAACGGGDDASNDDPQTVIEGASLEGVKSGELDLSLEVNAEGKEGGDVKVSLSGPFEAPAAKGDLPQLDMTAKVSGSARGEDLDFNGGVTFLKELGFVNYKGTDYEIDPTTFGILKATIEQSQQQEGAKSGDITACQKAAEGIKFSQFADHLKNEGEADVEGTSTTKVSGDLNVSGGADALIQLSEDPVCSSQLKAAGVSQKELEEAKSELSKTVKKAHIDLYVGDDDIVRKVAAELTIVPPDAPNEKVEAALEMTLTGVNEEQNFSPPANPKPLEGLINQLDIEPLELLEATEGGLGGLLEQLGGNPLEGFGEGSSSGK
jgi:hypothetical protein